MIIIISFKQIIIYIYIINLLKINRYFNRKEQTIKSFDEDGW